MKFNVIVEKKDVGGVNVKEGKKRGDRNDETSGWGETESSAEMRRETISQSG